MYGECSNFAVLKGHTGPVVQLTFSTDGLNMFTASTDKTGAVWDIETGERVKRSVRVKLKEARSKQRCFVCVCEF